MVIFETEVENEIALRKTAMEQNAFIKIYGLGIILLGKEFYTQ